MVASISHALARIKQNWESELGDDVINDACRQAGHTWRDRLLTPVLTFRLFLLQILYGNTACGHVPHLAQKSFTGAAYCDARKRLPRSVLESLLARTVSRLGQSALDGSRWLGHRLFLVDGSSFSMPDKPELANKFGYPANQQKGCGFPVAHWIAMMHCATGLIMKVAAAPLRTNDPRLLPEIHPELQAGDVLVGDRMFCSFAHFSVLLQRGAHGLFRLKDQIVDFTPGRPHTTPRRAAKGIGKGLPRSRWVQALGEKDQIVEWFRPLSRPEWLTAEQLASLPDTLRLRELCYRIAQPGFRVREVTVVTTLLDAAIYSADELAGLYFKRWRIEVNFRHVKTTMGMDAVHCHSVEGVLKELTMFALVYNLVRLTMHAAAERQQTPVERLSFIDALRWLMHADANTPLTEIRVNPHRPDRFEPRVIKLRPKHFPRLKKPRAQLRQEWLDKALTP